MADSWRWEAADIYAAWIAEGKPALITDRGATELLKRYGFNRWVTGTGQKAVPLLDVAHDLARRLNDQAARERQEKTYSVLDENGDVLESFDSWGLALTYWRSRTDRATVRDNVLGQTLAWKEQRTDDT